jgi:hypothetical protein
MDFWVKGNELIVVGNVWDWFFEGTVELKDVAHG